MPTKNIPAHDTLTIQEMARQSGLSEHPLRYYERIGHRRCSARIVSVIESL